MMKWPLVPEDVEDTVELGLDVVEAGLDFDGMEWGRDVAKVEWGLAFESGLGVPAAFGFGGTTVESGLGSKVWPLPVNENLR